VIYKRLVHFRTGLRLGIRIVRSPNKRPMNPEELLEKLFNEALERNDRNERARYLDEACGGDAALREQLEQLVRAHEDAGGFLFDPSRKSTAASATQFVEEPVNGTEKACDSIGRYKLLQQIGEGGCGIVYMAEQEEPVRRRVALKVIKLGMDTKQVIARFGAERQALALMEHPNIAKVLDAGATETGRPFFVMELVRGIKITDYCDQNNLSTKERLDLFIKICQAIQHAHQKGIIHRDIKPSNILVTLHDGGPVPKVIDFGVAKATEGRLTDTTVYTQLHQFIGTPAYMSPEQAEMSGLDIDTRSDIYSLGVLLYELLTGRTPFDPQELMSQGIDAMRKTIREKEPVRPSTKLATLKNDELTTTAKRRASEAPKLIHLLKGDLDWIVMKCLEKERGRRYETASGLAVDIERYLNHEPVVARPPSQWYSLQKMARRNRTALIAGALIVLTLLIAVVALTISNVRIRDERTQKETALQKMQKSEQEAKVQLFVSLKSQALARRQSRQIGQRLDSLTAIREAAQIRRDADLRDAAIAALAVPDLRPGETWQAYDSNNRVVAFDPDYKLYVRIEDKSVISIRTVADDREVQRFPSGPAPQRLGSAFQFSPDGRLLAKFEVGNRWSVWRVESGQLVFRTASSGASGAAISSDSTELAIPIEDSIVVFDLHAGEELRRWRVEHPPHTLAFSPDNRQLAAGAIESDEISVFDAEHGRLVSKLAVGKSTNPAMAWHPSGKYLAVSLREQIQFWDVKAAAMVSKLEGHAQIVTTMSFDPSGNWLITDSWDGTPRLWQPSPGREWIRFFSGLNELSFSRNGRWAGVTFPGDGKAQLLEFIPSEVYHTFVENLSDSRFSFAHSAISPDGHLLALASSEGASIRELPSGRDLAFLPAGYVRMVQFHPNGDELLMSEEKGFEVWKITRDLHAPTKIRFSPLRKLALPFAPDEFALGQDGRTMAMAFPRPDQARIVDLYTGTSCDLRFAHTNIDYVALSHDAHWLATSGWHSTQAQLWNAKTGELLLDVPVERAYVTFTPDGRELVVSTPQAYEFYDVTTRKITRHFQRESSMHPGCIAYSSDGQLMALEVSPGVIRLCEVRTGRTIANLQDPNSNVSSYMAFTPDGTQLIVAATYEHAIHRWDLRAMRTELKAMGLDWDWPEFPPESDEAKNPQAFEVEVLTEASR
jgi:serine/threonine protein kinase/WD40 repeat protein